MTDKRSRRTFLGVLGASALGVSALGTSALVPRAALAEEEASKPPKKAKRFVGIYFPHGRAKELWTPGEDFALSYENSILSPFDVPDASLRKNLLVVSGVDLSAGIAVGTTGHDASRVILTGSGASGRNASLDQFLATEAGLGKDTLFSSIALGVGQNGTDLGQNLSYSRGGMPVPKWIDPVVTFDELFGLHFGLNPAELEARRRAGKSVLDHTTSELATLRRTAPRSAYRAIEAHTEALFELEKRLLMVPPVCEAPSRPAAFPSVRSYGGGERYFDAITDLQIDLLVRALSCDLVRFATLFLADLSRGGSVPGYPNDVHSEVAHRYDARTEGHPGTPKSWKNLAIQNRASVAKIARLARGLEEANLLDETIIYASSDMGDTARHSSRDVPTLLVGGENGPLHLGRHLDFADKGGIPNNRLLVSIANAFGVPLERFGQSSDPKIVEGRLDGILKS